MNASPIVDADNTAEIHEGPGSRLRQARLSKRLEVSRVAAQLHLSDAMVEALERDDYDNLPGPVFIRGYLKNYTRLLGLDSQRVLDDYERVAPADAGGSSLAQRPRLKDEVESSHVLVRAVTWIVVILFIGLLVFWWRGSSSWPFRELDPAATGSDSPASMDKAVASPEQTSASVVASAEKTVPETGQPAVEPASVAVLKPGEGTETPESRPERTSEQTAEKMRIAAEPAAAADAQPSVEPAYTLETMSIDFRFSDSSWLDVRDASGENKIIGVMAKDTRRTLEGAPPFSVVLGNARVVEVWVNEQPYDFSKHIRGDVARFEVDSSQR